MRPGFKLKVAAAIAAAATILSATAASADIISNNVDGTVDATAEAITLTLGSAGSDGSVTFFLIETKDDGKPGCNITGSGSQMTASVTSSNTAVATVSPSSIVFANCESTPSISVTRQGLGSTTVTLARDAASTTYSPDRTFDFAPATFTVNVQDPPAPPNTPPTLNLPASPVTAEATSASGALVSYAATATDAEDDPDPTPACIPASGSLFAIGLTEVDCTVTDGGGASATGSFDVVVQDTTDPVVTISTGATQALTGWYNIVSSGTGGIVISVSATDAVGVVSLSCTDDGSPLTLSSGTATLLDGEHLIACSATDAAGNAGNDSETFKVDQTAPIMTGSVSPAPNTNGWNNSAVTVSYVCSDATSGIDPNYGCPADDSASSDGLHQFNKATADYAGNVITPSFTVLIDGENPTISGSASPAANADGWNNTDVTVSFDCLDTRSGIASCTTPEVLTEGANQSAIGTATDNADNQSTATVGPINIDKTNPSIGFSRTPANAAGWNNAPVTVTFTCTDGLSGVKTLTPPETLSTDGALQSSTGTCVDTAGNSASVTVTDINIDQSKPVIGGVASPAANENGWNNGSVTVSFTCTEVGPSGIALDTVAGDVLSSDGADQFVTNTGACTDRAGNSADPSTVSNIDIDKTKPVITGSATPTPNGAGWNNTNVVVSFVCSDGLSGVDSDTVAGATLSTDGADQFVTNTGACTDSAGNSADPSTVSNIDIDKTKPVITGSATPTPNGAGWNNTNVVVSFVCSDGLSGVDSDTVAGATLSTDGADQFVTNTGSCSDAAGNSADPSTVSGIDIDKTDPVLNVSGTAAGTYDICVTGGAISRPTFAPTDALSGIKSSSDSWSAPSSSSGVGSYTYSATADDNADNVNTENRAYSVVYGAGAFSGVLQPVNADGTSRFKLGSTIPVKFRLTCGTTPISSAIAKLTVRQGDSIADPGVDEAISTSAATTGNLFRYDATGQQYIFNLSTKQGYYNPGATTPIQFANGTWTLWIGFDDGTTRPVKIQLVK